jgi:hypothetical protein
MIYGKKFHSFQIEFGPINGVLCHEIVHKKWLEFF